MISKGIIFIIIFDLVLDHAIREEFLSPAPSLGKPLFSGEGFSWCGRAIEVQSICPARALRALGLLLADGTPTGGRGEDFLSRQPDFFTETAVTPERKVEKSFPRWEINRHVEG